MNKELVARAVALASGRLDKPPAFWLRAWRGIVDSVREITIDDPRIPGIMAAIQLCDIAFASGDWPAFCQAAEEVRQAVNAKLST